MWNYCLPERQFFIHHRDKSPDLNFWNQFLAVLSPNAWHIWQLDVTTPPVTNGESVTFFYNDCLDWLDVDHFEVVEKTTLNEILGHFHLSSLLHKLQMMKPSFITTDILTLDWPILKPCDTLIAYLFSLHSMAGTLLVTLYIQIVCLNELLIRQHNRQLFIKE